MSGILGFIGTTLNIVGVIFIIAGGITWFLLSMVYRKHERYAIAAGLVVALIGGGILTISSFIYPHNIQVPDVNVSPPEISIPQVSVPQVSIPPVNR